MLAQLAGLSVYACREVQVTVSLNRTSVRLARDVASSLPALFVRCECRSDTDALGSELARLLGESPGLASFTGAVLSKPDADGVERMMKAHKIPPLPAAWGPCGEPDTDRANDQDGRAEASRGGVAASAPAAAKPGEQGDIRLGEGRDGFADDGFAGCEWQADQPEAGVPGSISTGSTAARARTAARRPPHRTDGEVGRDQPAVPPAREKVPANWSPSCLPWEAGVSYSTLEPVIGLTGVGPPIGHRPTGAGQVMKVPVRRFRRAGPPIAGRLLRASRTGPGTTGRVPRPVSGGP